MKHLQCYIQRGMGGTGVARVLFSFVCVLFVVCMKFGENEAGRGGAYDSATTVGSCRPYLLALLRGRPDQLEVVAME